jgi:hypothetical protein
MGKKDLCFTGKAVKAIRLRCGSLRNPLEVCGRDLEEDGSI